MSTRIARWLLGAALAAPLLLVPTSARADAPVIGPVIDFLIPGLYVPETASARDVLGNTLYHHETELFKRRLGPAPSPISFGLSVINNSSNFFPFTGARQLTLIGPSLRVTAPVFGAFAQVGGYATNIKSDRGVGVDDWDFTPSAAAGFRIPIAPFVGLTAQYRITEKISGVDLNGFSLELSLF